MQHHENLSENRAYGLSRVKLSTINERIRRKLSTGAPSSRSRLQVMK
jgi:hypothetical protein